MRSTFLLGAVICFNLILTDCLYTNKQKPIVVVDVDVGADDAMGILLLLASHKRGDIELKAITCVNGNTDVINSSNNVLRLLNAALAMDIPVYKGATHSLLPSVKGESKNERYYGHDGLRDLHHDSQTPDSKLLQSEHAVNALYRIVSEQPNKVTVIFLGPLTNAALVIKMYPEFADLVKDIFVMGGNYTGVGNLSDAAEFNFGTDPEGAFILLNEVKKPIVIFPWETCKASKITWDWRLNVMGAINNPEMHLMNTVEKSVLKANPSDTYETCDPACVAIMLNPRLVKKDWKTYASVELNGKLTRGEMVPGHISKREPNVVIVTQIDEDLLKKMLLFAAGHKNSGY